MLRRLPISQGDLPRVHTFTNPASNVKGGGTGDSRHGQGAHRADVGTPTLIPIRSLTPVFVGRSEILTDGTPV